MKTLAAYDITIKDGKADFQPGEGQSVEVAIQNKGISEEKELAVWHLRDDGSVEQVSSFTVKGHTIRFPARGFSVYMVVETILEKTLTASDGRDYTVTVRYDSTSGLPVNAQLSVSEVKQGSAYEKYVKKAANALGQQKKDLAFARAFDITLTDPDTGAQLQPTKNVQVSVRLAGEDLSGRAVNVVHLGKKTEALSASVRGSDVEFETDGFSVYVVTGSQTVHYITYTFYGPTSEGWQAIELYNDQEQHVTSQRVKAGETPTIPQISDPNGGSFQGWYFSGDGGTTLAAEPYNFEQSSIPLDTEVGLYPKFTTQVEITFCGQYSAESNTFPVSQTIREDLTAENGGTPSARVNIRDVSTAYTSGGTGMAFYAWSRTPISVPNAANDDEGAPVSPIEYDADGCITVTEDTKLYPIFKPVHWLSFYAAQSGMSASYNGPEAIFDYPETNLKLEGRSFNLPVPTRAGYEFQGWYINAVLNTETVNGKTVETVDFSNASPVSKSDGSAFSVSVDYGGAYILNGKLWLKSDVTLYAKWKANYRLVLWKQSDSDSTKYEYADTLTTDPTSGAPLSAEIGAVVSLPDACKDLGGARYYEGYHFNDAKSDSSATIQNQKAMTVLNVYYDREGAVPAPSVQGHTLTFYNSESGSSSVLTQVENVSAGSSLGQYKPNDPVSTRTSVNGRQIYNFGGWYLDPSCSIAADLSKMTMPDRNLDLYAGWTPKKFAVHIDTNYGALYAYKNGVLDGTGATYFNNTYEDEPISEYTHVTRDYVPSSSGTYYFANRDWIYNDPANRQTFYTDKPGEATEDKTFEYVPGQYSYVGWYEVKENGVEETTPYDFTQRVDHDTTLRLHWRRKGSYYLGYDAGTGTIVNASAPGKQLRLDDTFQDCATVTVNQTARPGDGTKQTFVGWKVKGSEGGTIYAPGQSFPFHAEDAIRTNGKDVVWLEAVYAQVGTATVIYNANGGGIQDGADYGSVPGTTSSDPATPLSAVVSDNGEGWEATVTGLKNNSALTLSDGTGFYRDDNAQFLGWSTVPAYDAADADAQFFPKGSTDTYAVDTLEPRRLYAVWGVKATFHLNPGEDAANHQWGGSWTGYTQETVNGETVYTCSANLGAPLAEPEDIPQYTGSTYKMFLYWSASETEQASGDAYDFTQPVRGSVNLYARWGEPKDVPVHAVDASAAALEQDPTGWTVPAYLKAGRTATALTGRSHVQAPTGYVFDFAAAAKSMEAITERNQVTEVQYDAHARRTKVKYQGSTEFVALENGTSLYFVYHRQTTLALGYKAMESNGALTGLNPSAPNSTGPLGTDVVKLEELVINPLSLVDASYTNYAFALGVDGATDAQTTDASKLQAITDAVGAGGNSASLWLRGSWKGIQYSRDGGSTWLSGGYNPIVYVVYYTQHPTVVNLREETLGTQTELNHQFRYRMVVTQEGQTDPLFDSETREPILLRSGEVKSAILFHDGTNAQSITITQTAVGGYDTAVESDVGTSGEKTWSYTSDGTLGTVNVTFRNTYTSYPISVHVARVESDGQGGAKIVCRDDMRSTQQSNYQFSLDRKANDETEPTRLLDELPADGVYYDENRLYGLGAIVYAPAVGNGVVVSGVTGVETICYEPVGESGLHELVLRDSSGTRIGALESGTQLYYLYYPMPRIHYVKAHSDGTLVDIPSQNNGFSSFLPYNGAQLTMNGQTVVQDQLLEVRLEDLVISQSGNHFRMPAFLDDGSAQRYLRYAKLGAGNPNITSLSGLTLSENLTLRLRIQNNAMQYYNGVQWNTLPLLSQPTIYAIYEERGYDLQITKTVDVSKSGSNDIFTSKVFPVTITPNEGTTLTDGKTYKVEGSNSGSVTVAEGKISLEVKDGSKLKLIGLPKGSYTITELENDNYTLSKREGPIVNPSSAAPTAVDNNRSFTVALDAEHRVDLFNEPKAICKLREGTADDGSVVMKEQNPSEELLFYTLNSAMDYVKDRMPQKSARIEMLTDYRMPAADQLTIPSGCNIVLTSAKDGQHTYTGNQAASIKRDKDLTNAPLFTNKATLSLQHITLDGDDKEATAPLLWNEGTLSVGTNAALRKACNKAAEGVAHSGEGGAIHSVQGTVTISGGTIGGSNSFGNQAAKGGALYMENGTLELADEAEVSYNQATVDGGGIYVVTGTVTLTSGTLNGNKAENGNGGAIYSVAAIVNGNGGTIGGSNQAVNGGGIYADTGTVELNGTAVQNNSVTGNGGGVYVKTGTVTVSAGTFSGNKAENGFGGTLAADTGTINITGGTIGGTTDSQANQALNGAAVYAGLGNTNITGGTISHNIPTDSNGGAVGVGEKAVSEDSTEQVTGKLYLSGDIVIYDNLYSGEQHNVCLDVDSDGVINVSGMGSSANVGIYVPDTTADGSALFDKRGNVGAEFGRYTNTSNLNTLHNDRQPNLDVHEITTTMKLSWGKAIKVEIRYKDHYSTYDTGFPPKSAGTQKYTNNSYYPTASSIALSELGDTLRKTENTNLNKTAIYATAFLNVGKSTTWADYITRLYWEDTNGDGNYVWKVEKRDGSVVNVGKNTIRIYYSEPTYVSIENNAKVGDAEYQLRFDSLRLLGADVLSKADGSDNKVGYGLIFAKNGAIQDAMYPVPDGFTLAYGESVNILIPGGRTQNFTFKGTFLDSSGNPVSGDVSVPLRRTNQPSGEDSCTALGLSGTGLSGQTLGVGQTYQILFGEDKNICQVGVDDHPEIQKLEFSTLLAAVAYANSMANDTNGYAFTIEMLTDYLIPADDVLTVEADSPIRKLTLTTAADRYPDYAEGANHKWATLSRHPDNLTKPLIEVFSPAEVVNKDGNSNLKYFEVKNLDFDGKSLAGQCDGGAIWTRNTKVFVHDSNYKNFKAYNGGAIFVSFGEQYRYMENPTLDYHRPTKPTGASEQQPACGYSFRSYPGYDAIQETQDNKKKWPEKFATFTTNPELKTLFDYTTTDADGNTVYALELKVKNCGFTDCQSLAKIQRSGGGAIWTNAQYFSADGCDFTACQAIENTSTHEGNPQNQGGAIFHRIDSPTQKYYAWQPYCQESECHVSNSSFTRCVGMAGGGIETDANKSWITGCTFTGCSTKSKDGGAINAYLYENSGTFQNNQVESELYVTSCSFIGCTAKRNAGAIRSLMLDNTLTDCTFINNTAEKIGGAFFTDNPYTKSLTVTCSKDSSGKQTGSGCIFEGCVAKAGTGGAIHTLSKALVIEGSTISGCNAKTNGGGVFYQSDEPGSTVEIIGSTINGCTADQNGGGFYTQNLKQSMTIRDGSKISNNTAKGTGGGGGIYYSVSAPLTVDSSTVQGNQVTNASGKGGGIYCKKSLTLHDATIIENKLMVDNANVQNAAGVYLPDDGILTVGCDKPTDTDLTRIANNTTKGTQLSDLRLPESNGENKKCVIVKSHMDGEVYVVNAKKAGTIFGTVSNANDANFENPDGFSGSDRVFKADYGTLYGIVNRPGDNYKQIIWTGPPICKLTTPDGRLLYFKPQGADEAIFDILDDGKSADTTNPIKNRTSAFRLLRNPPSLFYYKDDGSVVAYTGKDVCVKMIVENYDLTNQITTVPREGTITLTTERKTVPFPDHDEYPLEQNASENRCTIHRPTTGLTESMMDINANLKLETIIFDGGRYTGAAVADGLNGGILRVNGTGNTVTLGSNAKFENSSAQNGGAVEVEKGNFTINGGVISSCSADASSGEGGAVRMNSTQTSDRFTFNSGNIFNCSAANGGGVAVMNGRFVLTEGGRVERNSATSGGGVYVNDSGRMEMSGTSVIMNNSATEKGGGIAVADSDDARVCFYGAPAVSRNTCRKTEDGTAKIVTCNLELSQPEGSTLTPHNQNPYNQVVRVIQNGLSPGANIGVYVPGAENSDSLYDNHGVQRKPFASYEDGAETSTLYGFLNDRNGLKGGLLDSDVPERAPNTVYWIKIYAVTVKKEVQHSNYVTDANGSPLDEKVEEQNFGFQTYLSGAAYSAGGSIQASSISGAYGEMNFTSPTSIPNGSMGSASQKFYLSVQSEQTQTLSAENLPYGIGYQVVEDAVQNYCPAPGLSRTGSLGENSTKAGTNETDWYNSIVTFTNILPVCKITDQSGNLLYREWKYGTFAGDTSQTAYIPAVYTELKDALDALENNSLRLGSNTNIQFNVDNPVQIQMLVNYAQPEALTIETSRDITLTTASTTATVSDPYKFRGTGSTATIFRGYNGASVFTVNGTLRLKNINLDGKKANHSCNSGNGGLLNIHSGLTTMDSTVELRNSRTTNDGGAVYVQANGKLVMNGGTIKQNSCGGNGAGVYLAVGSHMEMAGEVDFGGTGMTFGTIDNSQGNVCSTALPHPNGKQPTNGGVKYQYARQDIYLVEGNDNNTAEEAPVALHLTGNLSGEDGSVWVWCVTKPHREMLKPFAVIDPIEGIDDKSYTIFRNAQTDEASLCGSPYLTGVHASTVGSDHEEWVYWTGGFDVEFVKRDSFGERQAGAEFTLYTDADCENPLRQGGSDAIAESADGTDSFTYSDGTAQEEGTVLFTRVPSGVYYMKETEPVDGYENALWKKKSNGHFIPICDAEDGTAEPNVYLVLAGKPAQWPEALSELSDEEKEAQYGSGTEARDSAVFLLDPETRKALSTPDIYTYGVMNLREIRPEVILKKTDEDNKPLKGAKFDVLRWDRTPVAVDVTSTESGVIWVGKLHWGTYYLHEKVVPDGYESLGSGTNRYNWYRLTVDQDGIHEPELLKAADLQDGKPKPPAEDD